MPTPAMERSLTPDQRCLSVLMVTSEWPKVPGATAQFIKRQAEFLRAAGVRVDVLHFKAARRPDNYLRAWMEARRRIERNGYDLVHGQWGQSGLLALPKRLPLVVTLRGDDLGGIIGPRLRVTPAGRLLRGITRQVARAADAVIVVSAHMKALLPPGLPIHVVPSGLDLEMFRPRPREEARRHLGLPLEKRIVLFVGNPAAPRKRYALARQAVEILRRTLPAELIHAWRVPHADIPFLLNACDALLFTSMAEGSPNAVKEALACNTPVVSVPVGDVASRLHGVDGCELCPDDRPEALAAALERLLRSGRRSAGREAVQDLDERKTTEQVIRIYRSVLSRWRERHPLPSPRRSAASAYHGARRAESA